MTRPPQKITFGEMRAAGVRKVLIYCTDYKCNHFHIVPDDADRWPDDLRISDIEDRFVCTACGQRGADIRPESVHSGRLTSDGLKTVSTTRPRLKASSIRPFTVLISVFSRLKARAHAR